MKRVPWIALAALAMAAMLRLAAFVAPYAGLMPGCLFKRATGAACATCGLTRCAFALGQGQWREALHWHPAAVILLALLPWAALWDLRRAWRRDPYPALPDSRAMRFGAWALLAGIWILQAVRGI